MRCLHCLLLAILTVVSSCAIFQPGTLEPPPLESYLGAPDFNALSRDDILARLGAAQVVLAGETHDNPAHHQVQLQLLTWMEEAGTKPVVGVEWLTQKAQKHCDSLSRGEITVEQFAKAVSWKKAWGYPLKIYEPILARVRARRIKLIALNAPLDLVRQVARSGLASLSQKQRSQLPPSLNLDDAAYRRALTSQFPTHGVEKTPKMKNFVAAQIVRDETMAHNLARELLPWPDSRTRALALVGNGHLAHGLGLPQRIRRRLPGVNLLTVMPVRQSAFTGAAPGPAHGPPPADILAVTKAGPQRPRLGVFLKPHLQGLEVMRVIPQSPAQKAGIQKGDVLQAVDGKALTNAKQIHDAIRAAPFNPHKYRILRGSKEIDLRIILEKSP